jgi:hypothetical protein
LSKNKAINGQERICGLFQVSSVPILHTTSLVKYVENSINFYFIYTITWKLANWANVSQFNGIDPELKP